MLAILGLRSLEELIDRAVPAAIRSDLPPGMLDPHTEAETLADLAALAARNRIARSFIGMGYYGTVTPAVIVRPVLPKEPPPNVPPEQVGTIEVVVDEQGDVLNVKLISPANRFHERMLVSAAKMWKFRPAYKDGQPVRYRTRVRLTI